LIQQPILAVMRLSNIEFGLIINHPPQFPPT
jgi:hypothetical protein